MAGEAGFGMEKGQLKALLIKSKKEPVSCAVGKGKEAGSAYILLDKIKQPKALETALEKQFRRHQGSTPRHGERRCRCRSKTGCIPSQQARLRPVSSDAEVGEAGRLQQGKIRI